MTRDWTQEYFGITNNTPVSDAESSLRRKLDIAIKALKKIEILIALNLVDKSKISTAYKLSHQALTKIKEIK